jgi:hypothetical protein
MKQGGDASKAQSYRKEVQKRMTKEKKEYIQIGLAYNCIMLAGAVLAFALSLWLVVSGQLFREGVDGVFLLAVGFVMWSSLASVPVMSIREGLLRDVKQLWIQGFRGATDARAERQRTWQESPVH